MSNPPAAPLVEALAGVDRALAGIVGAAFEGLTVRGLTDHDVLELVGIAERLGRRVDALRVEAAAEVDDRSRPERGAERLSARSGCVNAVDLLCRSTGIAATSARMRIRGGRALAPRWSLSGGSRPAEFPAVRAAFGSGAIGFDSATAITKTLAAIADRCPAGAIAGAEVELVAAATGSSSPVGGADAATAEGDAGGADVAEAGGAVAPACSADDTRLQAEVWALVLDPDGARPDEDRAARKRCVMLGREREGLVPLSGQLLPEVAEQFVRLIDAHLNPRTGDPSRAFGVRFEPVGGPPVPGGSTPDDDPLPDPRTRAQKQHDVLASILGVAARSPETPSLGGAPPTLLVTVAADDLDRADGVAFLDGVAVGSGRTTRGTVSAGVARQIACGGGIQRLVHTPGGRIIELGSPQRVFTPAQRRAITARDGGCVVPGCHVPAGWCEIHHVEEAARGGPTHTDNGVMLCWWHHRTLGSSGWGVRMSGGMPEVRAPFALDPSRRWRPGTGSLHRERDRLRRRLTG